ncbi:hypothetical protein ACI798_04345 [Geodermatophilus sp. SYSU D01045]
MNRNHRTHADTPNRPSGRRLLGRLGLVAVTVAAGATLAASPAAATSTGVWYTIDTWYGDGIHDTWVLNADGDAEFEYFYFDTDEYPDGYADVGVLDLLGDGSVLFYDLAPLDGVFETVADANGRPVTQSGIPLVISPGDVPVSPPGMPNSGCLPFALPEGWECRPV